MRFGSVLPGKCNGICNIRHGPMQQGVRRSRKGEGGIALQEYFFGFLSSRGTRVVEFVVVRVTF